MKTEAVAHSAPVLQLRGSEGTGTSLLGKWRRIRTQVAFPDCCSASSIGGERSNGDCGEAVKVLQGKGGAAAAEGKAPVFPRQLPGSGQGSSRALPLRIYFPFTLSTEETEAQRNVLTSSGRLARKEPSLS